MTRRRIAGFTLVELMVATALMLTLGLMLIATLRSTVRIVTTGTTRGDAWLRAQTILARVETDLMQLDSQSESKRLISGVDPYGRPFLAFSRALPEERQSAAGTFAAQTNANEDRLARFDRVWRGRDAEDRYRSLGGVASLAYVFEPSEGSRTLYRGIVAPITFDPSDLYGIGTQGRLPSEANLFEQIGVWHAGSRTGAQAYPAGFPFNQNYDIVAEGVLYLGVQFLDEELLVATDSDGWRYYWESATPQSLPPSLRSSRQWPAQVRSQSVDNALSRARVRIVEDSGVESPILRELPPNLSMGFPEYAKITVTVLHEQPNRLIARLTGSVNQDATTLTLDDGEGFGSLVDPSQNYIKIGEEWIRFSARNGNTFVGCTRGVRGTVARAHSSDAEVFFGLSLSRTLKLPVVR
ncbi:MAG: prepilin-type N-terminal cleavage/methylation domain-containing protein [Planctomycetes bacterium]|nr:prepilin-type N-terminal cleavage/methylation domain-containing protein [Planctomycetota bacterium]